MNRNGFRSGLQRTGGWCKPVEALKLLTCELFA